MTHVKFATLCDLPAPPRAGRLLCEARSEEYTSWPSCRTCVAHVCPEHTVPGSEREEGGQDQLVSVYCTGCMAENGPEDTTTSTTKEPKQ